uniref:Mitochondrial genome maintenance exonuclease 1 n=1 Tax=Prolemur simus TaxID=1328070 RepID=A0A8C9DEC5_PROSS
LKMKAFQTICRQLRSSKRFSVEPAALVYFSTSCYSCGRNKKMNPYEEVDQEKYFHLVQSVLSFGGLARTPESLFHEDALLYGPVSKQKPPKQEEEARVPQNWFPIFNPERNVKPETSDPSIPLKIPLQSNVVPSVTQILQETMTKQQIFCLERWKQRMILELGENGFKEYTSSNSIVVLYSKRTGYGAGGEDRYRGKSHTILVNQYSKIKLFGGEKVYFSISLVWPVFQPVLLPFLPSKIPTV